MGGRWRSTAGRVWTRAAGFGRRRWKWLVVPMAVIAVTLGALDHHLDEPLRRQMEQRLNERLHGYTVTLRGLDFHIVGGSVDLLDLVVVQDLNPDPPVARIPKLSASIQWGELLRGHVVADFLIDRPVIHVNRRQLKTEAEDPVPIHTRGWQEALEAIYPFRINVFRVADGDLTYVEESGRPLHLRRVTFRAENIRTIRLQDHTYPSSLWLEAIVFDSGRFMLDGRADFLAEPHPGLRANVAVERVALDYIKPIAARYNLIINEGTMSANGEVEYGPRPRRRGQARRDGARRAPPRGARPADPGGHPDPVAQAPAATLRRPVEAGSHRGRGGRRWLDVTSAGTSTMSIDAWGRRHTFDCFECAIHLLAPTCDHCGCRIIGHGVEDAEGRMYCCAHCARKVGVSQLRA